MKTIALQDNLSKVKAVEDLYQQMLRFPGDAQEVMASEMQKRRLLRRRRATKTAKSDDSKLRSREESGQIGEQQTKGRKPEAAASPDDVEKQCSIDFRV